MDSGDESEEVLIPYDDSSSDGDAAEHAPVNDLPRGDDLDALRRVYAEALAVMPHVCVHNHAKRNLAGDPAFAALVAHCATGAPLNAHARPVVREQATALSVPAFRAQYATGVGQPIIIAGIPERDQWVAHTAWRADKVLETLGGAAFKLSERPNPYGAGRPLDVRLPLALYHESGRGSSFLWLLLCGRRRRQ